jgi:para-aminobenzoate synthetase component I
MKKKSNAIIDSIVGQFKDDDLILLESQDPDQISSGISYIAVRPARKIFGNGNWIKISDSSGTREFQMNPWEALKKFRKDQPSWMFGYLGYDLKNYSEDLHTSNPSLMDAPDFYFMEPEIVLKIDNGRINVLKGNPVIDSSIIQFNETGSLEHFHAAVSKADYIEKVKTIKERIREGDFYEMNYSYPMQGDFSGDPYWLYTCMREINPVPFGGYLRLDNIAISCASPERFLKKEGMRIISEPIKGTAPRSDNPSEDLKQRDQLMNEKNRAENLMIVDLVRHDLSRVSNTGSVRVTKLFDIQTFGTVHQLISVVEAIVGPDVNSVEIIKACFPMGSMTGAPKIKVMQAIEELECYKRGIYSGAIGYFTPDDDFDFNVVIRSAMIQNGRLIYPVGGAITSDSEPAEEWEETKIKARPITGVFKNKSFLRNEVGGK